MAGVREADRCRESKVGCLSAVASSSPSLMLQVGQSCLNVQLKRVEARRPKSGGQSRRLVCARQDFGNCFFTDRREVSADRVRLVNCLSSYGYNVRQSLIS